MKKLLPLVLGVGAIAFLMSFIIRVFNTGAVLKSSALGWWRASIGVVAIGILLALIELIREQSKTTV